MKIYCEIIALLFTVYLTDGGNFTRNKNFSALTSDSDYWIWGYVDDTTPTMTEISTTVTEKSSKNNSGEDTNHMNGPYHGIEECNSYNPPAPVFKTPGRRISEAKCDEYIWSIKVNEEILTRKQKCMQASISAGRPMMIPVIANGAFTAAGEFPHMVAIAWLGKSHMWVFQCGGSLISSKFVLTAAHCSSASIADTSLVDPIPKIVRIGRKNIRDPINTMLRSNSDVIISRIISHPKYKPPKQYYDIALMELEREVVFNKLVQPACLWGQRDISVLGTIAYTTGWGVLHEGSSKISDDLQAGIIQVLNDKDCNNLLGPFCNRNWCGMQGHQLCAANFSSLVDACQGDSGGPLQVKINLDFETLYNMYYVIGVTSFGIGCAQPGIPGVYTRVSSFIDWIEQIVWS